MKLYKYLTDKILSILLFVGISVFTLLILIAFKTKIEAIISLLFLYSISFLINMIYDYFRRKKFYDCLLSNLENLDQKYLLSCLIEKPDFYEGKLFYQILYETNKAMNEKIKEYEFSLNDFKEYIELWIHEVKIPISSLSLMAHNHNISRKYRNEIQKIDDYIEQVLYYVRSENTEQDYLILETSFDKIIQNIALRNKNILLENKIEFIAPKTNLKVLTDSKWLEFIMNQIINNSIKYHKEDAVIRVEAKESSHKTIITILDNGIGIKESDLPRVFDKTFTGENGHHFVKSTGFGLYITKKLCDKLGIYIKISSKVNEYTKVELIIPKNHYFDILK